MFITGVLILLIFNGDSRSAQGAQFECSDGSILDTDLVCNHRWDCLDGDDEANCPLLEDRHSIYVTSPGYDQELPYLDNLNITWTVKTSIGLGFDLSFRGPFHIEYEYDSLAVGKGLTGTPYRHTQVAVYSGAEVPSPIFLDSHEIWIRFQSDADKSSTGFHIDIMALNLTALETCEKGYLLRPSQICNVIWDCPDGRDEDNCDPIPPEHSFIISSSDVTSGQSHNLRVVWTATTSHDRIFSLRFLDLETEENFDSLRIGVGRECSLDVNDHVFSGSIVPESVTIFDHSLCLFYTTDYSIRSRGFVINVTTMVNPIVPDPSICGDRPAEGVSSRIIGGSDATLGDWPWIGLIRLASGDPLCSATLIHPEWAVTAAHCIGHGGHVVVFGNILQSESADTEQSLTFTALRHSEYSRSTFNHDIALLHLNGSVNVTDYVRPICLAETMDETSVYQDCLIAGWGITDFMSGDLSSEVLQEAALPIIDAATCNQYIGSLVRFFPSFMICAGFHEGGVDSCEGDSGGPLMCRNPGGGWDLVGVTSFGIFCAFPERPGIYTRVSTHLDFIREHIEMMDGF